MTTLANGTVVTSPDAHDHNAHLAAQGYTVRHVETFHDHGATFVHWDAPALSEADFPF